MPYKDPEARREARRRYKRRHPEHVEAKNAARAARRERHEVIFVGVDGEGVDRADGSHDYNLLSVGGRSLHHPDGRRLTTAEIFAFLWRCSRDDPEAVYVGFFLGYDFAQWLRDMPTERARMLLSPKEIARRSRRESGGNPTPFPVRWHGWEFDMLPNMGRFKLRPKGQSKWLYVCDAGSLYQTSLLRAIDPETWPEPICSDEEYRQIREGKEARSDNLVACGEPVSEAVIAYNVLENRVLSRLMERTNAGLVAMGLRLKRTQWHGPGQAAQAWLRAAAPGHTGQACRAAAPEVPEGGPHDAARRSYFGGWFELMFHGRIPGSVWEYDVNSAYPHVIADLPCLLHGKWQHGEGRPWPMEQPAADAPGRYCLVRADVQGSDPRIGAMLHRNPKGGVHRPHWTSGWYWLHELHAAIRAGLVDNVTFHEWWTYHACDCPPPFAAIRDLYLHRLGVGKQTPQGRAMRLVYNSSYGKIAQSVGDPMFGNAVYASLITAGCRTAITDAIASHPGGTGAVVMVATDGVYFTSPHPGLKCDSQRLGAWDVATKTNLSLFKPGVYWDDKAREAIRTGGRLELKSRGVNARALSREIDRIDEQWDRIGDRMARVAGLPEAWPKVTLGIEFGVITARQALNRGKWELCGRVEHDRTTVQSSAPHRKRAGPFSRDPVTGAWRSSPWHNEHHRPSVPYDKRFGLELKALGEDMPMLPEGEAAMLVAELLSLHDVHR